MNIFDMLMGYVPLYATPIMATASWWVWARTGFSELPRWRRISLLTGLVTGTVNATLHFGWNAYAFVSHTAVNSAAIGLLEDYITPCLLLAVFSGAIAGQGRTGAILGALGVMELILWATVGL